MSTQDLADGPAVDKTRCAVCEQAAAEDGRLLRCSQCRTVAYCSKECQKTDWKRGHKLECGNFLASKVWNSTTNTFGEKGPKRKTGARTRGVILQDLTALANAHNGDTFTVAAWLAMDLLHNPQKADTHVLAITLRRNLSVSYDTPRKLYTLVDAAVIPLSTWNKKFDDVVALMQDGALVTKPSTVLEQNKAQRLADGALGAVMVTCIELAPGETKTVEQALLETMVPTFQPLGVFKVHQDLLRKWPTGMYPVWKECLKNSLDGGAFSPTFTPYTGS
ncbi:hypothetical protein EXIGLDRAFT_829805 [Exidia glandulosa HHB12029]|uniref:MYND-type domain-containing protein n=1 Tax=Exidia glandulosa HHB12029 TaxID=1314781 RepID=A0A165PAT2_EXIGL|nr:hypothetical protein EXIGLDRAFT_829805 [Exidia glandulosa HHB12029]